MAHQT